MTGNKIVVPEGTDIRATYHRGGDVLGTYTTLPPGKYIVDETDELPHGQVVLAAADWDGAGRVTFHSNKHRYAVARRSMVVTIDLLTALQKEGVS
jgi:hypothetical protein